MFIKTDTILDRILQRKVDEIAQIDTTAVTHAAHHAPPVRDFSAALHRQSVALIAEVKHASPSKGVLIDPFDPVALAHTYAASGAAAISVLTDRDFFQGSLDDLRAVRAAVEIPLLRKEFVIDARQIAEGRMAGADAMLLIAAVLDDAQLRDLQQAISGWGMAALVEVHDERELERALKTGAALIGVNNRDLKSFHEDIGTTERLARLMPPSVTLVAESAIRTLDDVQRMGRAGAHAVLVGEGLVRADNIADKVRDFSSQQRM
ncbi:MAG: indole-3-glycerol phosphate synthase TrpC [bacterium]|nr:indole-3-glycerol phosphate synthase TrpC [bacterium]